MQARVPSGNADVDMADEGGEGYYAEAAYMEEVAEEGPVDQIDVAAYRLLLHQMFPDGMPLLRVRDDVVVILVPGVRGGVLSFSQPACISVRVEHTGAEHRPVVSWQCSC